MMRRLLFIRDLKLMSMHAVPSTTSRTPELITDGDDQLVLGIIQSGRLLTQQLDRELALKSGEGTLWSKADVSRTVLPDDFHFIGISLPRESLASQIRHVEDRLTQPIIRDNASLKLLRSYVSAFMRNAEALPPEVRVISNNHIQDLVVLCLGASGDAAEAASTRGLRAARLSAVKSDIEANLGFGDVTIEALARRHGLSPRTLRELFNLEQTTFTDYLLERRLVRAHRLLTHPRYADRTIAALALEAGFGDVSYFNQSFRRRYGATPSDVRVAAGIGSRKKD